MPKVEALLVLAEAVAEGRLTASEFATVCLPLYKYSPYHFSSEQQYQAATDLFYLADDYWTGEGEPLPGLLTADQVQAKAVEIATRLRSLLD